MATNLFDIAEEPCVGLSEGFASALTVWLNKPHVVNRRLCGSRLEYFKIIPKTCFSTINISDLIKKQGFSLNSCAFADIFIGSCDAIVCEESSELFQNNEMKNGCIESLEELSDKDVAVIIRQLLPKQPERHANIPELAIFDKEHNSCTFIPLKPIVSEGTVETPPTEVVYCFSLRDGPKRRLCLSSNTTDCSKDSERKLSLTWIQSQLLQKLARWSEQPNLRTGLASLCLLSVEDYSRMYSELKNKYGIPLAKKWPEKTSAQKYVFEDVAIATYLLILWEDDRRWKGLTKKQSFVDLGCGNGLLVHILASEGHPGYGIDVRRRKIWDLYGPETILKEMSITPSWDCLFPDADWLIGNHSDELTPWIPVMAARSSYTCNYFVLPCCMWDFNSKYSFTQKIQTNSENSGKYRLYLDFVKTVGESCGYKVEEDMLRIPSTKRVCFIGRERSYKFAEEEQVDEMRQNYISSRCENCSDATPNGAPDHNSEATTDSQWVSEFTPRSKKEVTRNCVTIKKETKDYVIRTVFDKLLLCDNCEMKAAHDGRAWNKGGKLPLGDVAVMFDRDLLLELKSECGGLQTLLRNSSHIFQVSGGLVQLRDFTLDDPFKGRKKRGNVADKSDFFKTSLCWYHENHPDGCPRMTDKCSYAHGLTELRPKPQREKEIGFVS